MNGLFLGDKRVAGVKTVVAESTVVYEYAYDPMANPAATVQSIVERISPIAEGLETLQEGLKTVRENADELQTKTAEQGEEITALKTKTTEQEKALAEKQDALSFDGEYDAETNKAATVQTVAGELARMLASAPENLNTLEEIAAWIAAHPEDVAAMNAAIQTNATNIASNTQKIDGLISYGVDDMVAGESELETGKIYLVYE